MEITREDILRVAELARLDLKEEDIERLVGQIDTILEYIKKLNMVNTEGVLPTSHAISLVNAFREDEAREHLHIDQVLSNAPEQDEGHFIVPKVVN